MFTEEEKKFLQTELLTRISENMHLYESFKDLNAEDTLRMDILRKINPEGFGTLKERVQEMILKAK
ncbi:MAG: hypothetical protein RSF68_01935 [Myroides sp.]